MSERGLFLVLEGGDGVGKSTQAKLLTARLRRAGREVVLTRQPGDTAVGLKIRELLLDPQHTGLDARAEALLYAADKAQHVAEVVRPALARGAVVVCDRYVDSMLAYQGAGRVLAGAEVERLARWATDGLRPRLTVLLDLDPGTALTTITGHDRIEAESLDFHQRARAGFAALVRAEPGRYLVLGARRPRRAVAAEIWAAVAPLAGLPASAGEVPPGKASAGDGAAGEGAVSDGVVSDSVVRDGAVRDRGAGEMSTGEGQPGEMSTGERQPGEMSTGERQPGEMSTGELSDPAGRLRS